MKLINFSQNLSAVNFSKVSTFSKFHSFYEEPIWCDIIIFDEIVFFFNIRFSRIKSKILVEFILNWLSYVSFFPVLYLMLLVADITFITSLLPQVYVFPTSHWLFHLTGRKWSRQPKGQHVFTIYITNVTLAIYLKLLYVKFTSNWANIKEL